MSQRPRVIFDGQRPEAECPHEEGARIQAWSEDGEGYYIWKCVACGWETVDDMP